MQHESGMPSTRKLTGGRLAPTTGCRICNDARREQIESLIYRGVRDKDICEQYPDLSASSLYNHRRKCIPAAVDRARYTIDADAGKRLVEEINRQLDLYAAKVKEITEGPEWVSAKRVLQITELGPDAAEAGTANGSTPSVGDTVDNGAARSARVEQIAKGEKLEQLGDRILRLAELAYERRDCFQTAMLTGIHQSPDFIDLAEGSMWAIRQWPAAQMALAAHYNAYLEAHDAPTFVWNEIDEDEPDQTRPGEPAAVAADPEAARSP